MIVSSQKKPKRPVRVKYIAIFFLVVILYSFLGLLVGFFLSATTTTITTPSSLSFSNIDNGNILLQTQQDFRGLSKTTINNNNIILKKPPIENYIQGWNITGNVSWLLDFAIVGFPKTGTSTLMVYLENQTDTVFTFTDERCELGYNQHVKLLHDLYKEYRFDGDGKEAAETRKMGIKCPRDLEVDLALQNYHDFFPTTKFVVGLRNPIPWFESFYNFRITNEFEMPPPQRLIGKCRRTHWGVCTNRANFSQHLSKIEPWRDVFLYDIAQLEDKATNTNATTLRAKQFLNDLSTFLNLSKPLTDPMIWIKPGQTPESIQRAKELNALKMNICEDQYNGNLRKVLQQHASESATWILETFLKRPNVHVSSPEYFRKLIHAWHEDPCVSKS